MSKLTLVGRTGSTVRKYETEVSTSNIGNINDMLEDNFFCEVTNWIDADAGDNDKQGVSAFLDLKNELASMLKSRLESGRQNLKFTYGKPFRAKDKESAVSIAVTIVD